MKILLSSFGTRGDVQPYLALAVGLQRSGHQVTLSTSRTFSDWIHAYGVRTQPIRLSMQEVMQQPEVQAVLRSKNLLRQILLLRKVMGQSSEMARGAGCRLDHPKSVGLRRLGGRRDTWHSSDHGFALAHCADPSFPLLLFGITALLAGWGL